jgi:Flp pilus assembly protein TadB
MDFGKKKKVQEALKKAEEEKRIQIQKALKVTEIQLPERESFTTVASEYKKFLEESKIKPKNWYENLCSLSEKIFPIDPSPINKIKFEESLKAAYLNATPKGAYSLSFLTTLAFTLFVVIATVLGGGLTFFLIGMIFAAGVFYYFYTYPQTQAKVVSLRMSADTVLAILYMVIYMRSSPNLEGAVKFAAQNLTGPLAWDLRKLLWDIEFGTYPSADSALINYIFKWKDKNKDFADALHLLRSTAVEPSRREIIFNETISLILNGTRERAKHYAAGLRMPMMLIHAMGVLLPVMGLVLFPVVLIFISDVVKPIFVFFGYNILLPAVLYFLVSYILQSKPPTFSQPDISSAKGIPPLGKFAVGRALIPIWPIALLVAAPTLIFGLIGLSNPDVYTSVNSSLLIVFGLAGAISIYAFLDSYQKMKVRNDIEKIENEFSVALFQLGNVLSSGVPIELAIDKARENLKTLKIAEMFEIVSFNMKKFGYTFEQALFDKEVGAIWYYPSRLIQSIMQTIIQSAQKSVKFAADSMIVISQYLKGVHDVKEEIDEILGETVSSMKFLAMFLAPLVAGITLTMAVVILQILTNLGRSMSGLLAGAGNMNAAQGLFLMPWLVGFGGELPITPSIFQLIVGLYMIETAVLLAVFLNGIQYGDDAVGMRNNIWSTLIIGIAVYSITWFITYSMFGGAISSLLTPVT